MFCVCIAAVAGMPLDLLQQDYWVPGVTARQDSPKFHGKEMWREILHPTGETCMMWAQRMTKEPIRQISSLYKFKFLLAPYLEQNTVQTLEDFERKVQKDSTNKAKVCLGLCLFLLLSYFLFKMYSMLTKSISDMFSKNFTFLCHLPCP